MKLHRAKRRRGERLRGWQWAGWQWWAKHQGSDGSYLWAPSLGLPGFRCASIAPLPDVLIFSCLPELLEAAFRALEGLLVVAAAVDMDYVGIGGRAR